MARGTRQGYQERLNRVLGYLEARLGEDVSLEKLAEVACFSPHHFHRIFTGMVGESVKAHVRRLRLERAAHRLYFTGLRVTDIALDSGYDSPEAFSRAFRAQFSLSPGAYRDAALAGTLPAASGRTPSSMCTTLQLISEGAIPMEATVKTIEPLRVAFVRHIGPYEQCESAWEKLCAWAGPKNLLGPETPFIGLCHDDPEITPPEKIRYDACVSVPEGIEPEGEVGIKEIGGGSYAVTMHTGPYQNLHATYAWLCGVWAVENGQELMSEPSLEFYLNDPQSTPPEELKTEVYVKLADPV